MNLPNKLTVFRILLIPVFVTLMGLNFDNHFLYALMVFIIAAITDALDGNIARKYNLVTDFGKFMDPLADKLLVISALICLIEAGLVPGWIVLIIISRELAVSIMRAIAASNGKVIAAATSGKLKTIFQMISTILLIFGAHSGDRISIYLGTGLIYLAAILTIYSGYEYFSYNRELFEDR